MIEAKAPLLRDGPQHYGLTMVDLSVGINDRRARTR